ncbi:MAG: hypothetical protein FWF29_11190 [Treponema sp.]|nr:hypothetical protein [Treponema sp.]
MVNKSQIRTVIRTFRDKLLSEIFPGRKEVPKSIIFAKTDSHADDIIQIVREEFGEGNQFCRKITYNADKPETVLSEFRNSYYPRIAVTVDMIAVGIDVKPVECMLFMRDVHSRNYFEQMKGRGTRTLMFDDLQKVTPSATGNKARFVIVDAVGVTQSLKTESRPLTLQMVQEVYDAMEKYNLSTEQLWSAYSYTQKDKVRVKSPVSKLIDIVSLLRFEIGIATELAPYSDTVNYNFMRWTMAKNAGHIHFTDEQMNWLRMVRDFIANSMAITPRDLDLAPFNRHGGLGKFYSLFGDGYEALLNKMNLALAA